MKETGEFSFRLGSSAHGIGVFATHAIAQGTPLRLFGDERSEKLESRTRALPPELVPAEFRDYCIVREDKLLCPLDFGEMPVGWNLNHSPEPNASRDAGYHWIAARNIEKGEEITIDYNSLEEPEEARDAYYRS